MGFLDKLFKKKNKKQNNNTIEDTKPKGLVPVSEESASTVQVSEELTLEKTTPSNLKKNIDTLKEIFKDCDDVVYRKFKVGTEQVNELAVVYIDGLADKNLIINSVLEPLMIEGRDKKPENVKDGLFELVKDGSVSVGEIKEVYTLQEAVDSILVGDTVLLIDRYEKFIIIGSRGAPTRGISQSESETVVRGPRDGFVETAKVNISLIRKRIRDSKLKIKSMKIGERSKTDIAIMYIEDIANKTLIDIVEKRLKSIKIDAILESSYIEQLIEDNHYSPFPQIENTERPDVVAGALYEGRVAIVIDNTPFVLIAPATLAIFLQSSEDYYQRWILSTLTRLTRYLAVVITLLGPALYIALTSFHPGLLPTQLALYIAATRMTVPFPAFVEAFIMEITIEFLREAGSRMSGPIGTTISIVGGLVIGQAAVEAGIVSPLMVIIVAITAITSFMLPSFGFASAFRILRFIIMILATVLGLYGIMLGLIIIITHLVILNSFGVPYLDPFTTVGKTKDDLKDTVIKLPLIKMRQRPKITNPIDEDRLVPKKDINNGDDRNDRGK